MSNQRLLLLYALSFELYAVCVLLHHLAVPILFISECSDCIQILTGAVAVAIRSIEITIAEALKHAYRQRADVSRLRFAKFK